MSTLHKAAWFCIQDRRVLFTRSAKNKDIFYLPGGVIEPGENEVEALVREIKEETDVDLVPDTIKLASDFSDHAHGRADDVMVKVSVHFADFTGKLSPSTEIAELAWFSTADSEKLYGVGLQAVQWLKEKDLID